MADAKTALIQDGEHEVVIKTTLRIITSALATSTAHVCPEDRAEIRRLLIEGELLDSYSVVKQTRRSKGEVLDHAALKHVYNAVAYFSRLLDDEAVQAVWDDADKLKSDSS